MFEVLGVLQKLKRARRLQEKLIVIPNCCSALLYQEILHKSEPYTKPTNSWGTQIAFRFSCNLLALFRYCMIPSILKTTFNFSRRYQQRKLKTTKVSYKKLIISAILSSPNNMLKLTEIYDWILERQDRIIL